MYGRIKKRSIEDYLKIKLRMLRKAFYDLQQACRQWNETLNQITQKQGFKSAISKRCLYFDLPWLYVLVIF